ncbi:hypothetical protein ACN9MB_13115 [Dyella kyungheensis]
MAILSWLYAWGWAAAAVFVLVLIARVEWRRWTGRYLDKSQE